MFRSLIAFLLLFVLVIVGYQFYNTFKNYMIFKERFVRLEADARSLEEENRELLSDLRYFSKVENLIKELRSRFNYRFPDEKFIIVVPRPSTDGQQPITEN